MSTSTNVVPLRSGGQMQAIVPTNIEEAFRLAKAISVSGLAPNGMKDPEQILIAILHGMEVGLKPMMAVQKIAVINGRPTMWGDAIPALLYSHGFKVKEWVDGDTAHCTVTRPDGTETTRTFSMKDAGVAGLTNKPGPWKQYPMRMCAMRARAFAARDGAADVLAGMYIREELDGGPLESVTVREAPPEPPEIPDIPDFPAVTEDDPPIADPAGMIASMKEDMEAAIAAHADISEVQDQWKDLIPRLPEDMQADAYKALEMEPPE